MPPPDKKDRPAKQAARFANRASDRLGKFAKDARAGTYDANRLASDVSNSLIDLVDLWSGFLGLGASPQVGIADFAEHPPVDWKAGQATMVRIIDQVPEDAVFPANAALNVNALKLHPIDGGATVNLQVTQVLREDDGYQLTVSVRDLTPGPGNVAAGEYFATLYYTTPAAPAVKVFTNVLRGVVT
jgi:hypothetical protein